MPWWNCLGCLPLWLAACVWMQSIVWNTSSVFGFIGWLGETEGLYTSAGQGDVYLELFKYTSNLLSLAPTLTINTRVKSSTCVGRCLWVGAVRALICAQWEHLVWGLLLGWCWKGWLLASLSSAEEDCNGATLHCRNQYWKLAFF